MNKNLLIGLGVGFLVCHFMYKRKYKLKDNKVDAKLNKAKKNLEDFLKQEGVLPHQFDTKKVANDILTAESIELVDVQNFSGSAKQLNI